jgi:hypothetical protein|tara:strand:+ start:243 stop:944 length:702 start_codon:yes stop_codon:yes gene_type:complete
VGGIMSKTIPLWDIQEIREEAVQSNISLNALISGAIAAFVGLIILPKYQIIGTLVIILSFIPTIIGINRTLQIRTNQQILECIGVDEGHPWHPAEEGEGTKTRVKDVLGQWIALPFVGEISLNTNPITGEWVIRNEDEEILVRLGTNITEKEAVKMKIFINQALILSRAQEFEHDPTLKNARMREDAAEGILEREWLDTTPGQVEIEFGQMSRAREILGKKRNARHTGLDAEE